MAGDAVKLAKAIKKASRIFICGNGGSAANAIHIANDLIACGVKAQALTGDVATLTAIANDFDYGSVFSRQLETLGCADDLLVALSGSGRSANVLQAIQKGNEIGMDTWAIVGEYNADIPAANIAKHSMKWGRDMQEAEEKQLYIGHRVMKWLKNS